jgi:hypothetical protein
MTAKSLTIIFAAFGTLAFSVGNAPKVVLSGTAKSCYPGQPVVTVGVDSVRVSTFQVSKVPTLMASLKTLDTASTRTAALFAHTDSLYSTLLSQVNSTTALARATSNTSGAFQVSIAPVDSVLVFGYAHDQDVPFLYSYKTVSGRANLSFTLDMSRGDCSH